jgi:transcriptional regulator with XRE-family HTH domain
MLIFATKLEIAHDEGVVKSIHSEKNRVLRGLLRQLRKDAELTQAQLAPCLKVNRPLLSEVERGERVLDLLETVQYVNCLGLSLQDFVDLFENELAKNSIPLNDISLLDYLPARKAIDSSLD